MGHFTKMMRVSAALGEAAAPLSDDALAALEEAKVKAVANAKAQANKEHAQKAVDAKTAYADESAEHDANQAEATQSGEEVAAKGLRERAENLAKRLEGERANLSNATVDDKVKVQKEIDALEILVAEAEAEADAAEARAKEEAENAANAPKVDVDAALEAATLQAKTAKDEFNKALDALKKIAQEEAMAYVKTELADELAEVEEAKEKLLALTTEGDADSITVNADGSVTTDEQTPEEKADADAALTELESAGRTSEDEINAKANAARLAADEAQALALSAIAEAKDAAALVGAAQEELVAAIELADQESENLVQAAATAEEAAMAAGKAEARAAADGTDASRDDADLKKEDATIAEEYVAQVRQFKEDAQALVAAAQAKVDESQSKFSVLFSTAATLGVDSAMKKARQNALTSTSAQIQVNIQNAVEVLLPDAEPSALGRFALGASTSGVATSRDFYSNAATASALVAVVALAMFAFGRRRRAHRAMADRKVPTYGALYSSRGDAC